MLLLCEYVGNIFVMFVFYCVDLCVSVFVVCVGWVLVNLIECGMYGGCYVFVIFVYINSGVLCK